MRYISPEQTAIDSEEKKELIHADALAENSPGHREIESAETTLEEGVTST